MEHNPIFRNFWNFLCQGMTTPTPTPGARNIEPAAPSKFALVVFS
jgi:hypothetical protein